jgi:hypothetical protein
MVERGFSIDHITIYRWAQHYAPLLEKKCRAKLKMTNNSWRVDETYLKVKGQWMSVRMITSSSRPAAVVATLPRCERYPKTQCICRQNCRQIVGM